MRINLARHPNLPERHTVLLDGVDVTEHCIAACDDTGDGQGYVDLYKLDEQGNRYDDPNTEGPDWYRRKGLVVIDP